MCSSDLVDVSGNQNNGVIGSPAGLDVAPGPSAACPGNGALELDGASTHVTLPASLDHAVQGDALSALAWVYVEDAPDNPRLIANSHTDVDGLGFELALQDGTGPMFSVGLPGGIATISGSTALTAGAWHQVAGVYGDGTLTLYVDGQVAATGVAPVDGGADINPALYQVALGYDPAYDGDFLDGRLADVAIVPQALTAQQIAAIQSQVTTGALPTTTTSTSTTSTTSTTTPSSTTTTAPPASPTTTVAPACTFVNASMAGQADALWLLADRSTTAVDASGHGNDAAIDNAAAYDQAPGPATGCAGSGGLQFDGASTYVTAPASLDPSTTGSALTVVSFVQIGAAPTGQPVVVANDEPTTSGNGFSLSLATTDGGVTGGTFAVGATGGVGTAPWTADLAPGTWHQLVGTYDGTTVTAYLDGQPVGSGSTSGAVNPGAQPVSMGYDPVAATNFFQGLMADVAIVGQPLTGPQVQGMWAASQRYANQPATAGIASHGDAVPWALLVLVAAVGLAVPTRRRVIGGRDRRR